jgi:predicted ester cyclase
LRRSVRLTMSTMSTQENKTIVSSLIDGLFTEGDLGAVDTYLADDFVMHDPPLDVSADREGMRTAGEMIRKAFPDWHSDLHMLVAEHDIVVERFTASGTHRGELMGAAPTGNTVFLKGINIFRVRDGHVVEWWSRLDDLGLLRQLGITG